MADEQEVDFSANISQRHKKEDKDLQAKIQSMKHAIPKGDKKRKKQVMAEITQLENALKEKHKLELQNYSLQEEISEDVTEIEEKLVDDNSVVRPKQKTSKAQKRREKKETEEKEKVQRIADGETENIHSARNIESEKFKKLLTTLSLQVKEISPDGNCLYNAVADQLILKKTNLDYRSLRLLTSQYMRENRVDFIPFMTDQDSGDPLSHDMFSTYCDNIENTPAWGGHIEIRALSQALKIAMEIYQADSPVLKIGMDFDGDPIRLSYHKHEYGLGEHYNSLIPANNDIT